MGIQFLEEIVRARHQLSSGVLQNLQEFLFADQEAPQYGGKGFSDISLLKWSLENNTDENKFSCRVFNTPEPVTANVDLRASESNQRND